MAVLKNKKVSVCVCGWTDTNSEPIIGFSVANCYGIAYLIETIESGPESHTGLYLKDTEMLPRHGRRRPRVAGKGREAIQHFLARFQVQPASKELLEQWGASNRIFDQNWRQRK